MKKNLLFLSLVICLISLLACNPPVPGDDNPKNDISSVSAINNTQVEIVFTKDVDKTTAEDENNYSIKDPDGNVLAVISATRDGIDYNKVMLVTDPQQSVDYTLIITGVKIKDSKKIINTTEDPATFTGDSLLILISVTATSNTSVNVVFSKELDPDTAEVLINYSIPGLTINGAEYDNSMTVCLTTSSQNYNTTYTLTVSNVKDKDGDEIDLFSNSKDFQGYLFCVVNAITVNNTHLDVVFSNDVDKESSEDPFNYTITDISGSQLSVVSAVRDSVDLKKVRLETASQSACIYTLMVNGIRDISNETVDRNITKTFEGDALPAVDSITLVSFNKLTVTFSESVDASAAIKENYAISPALDVVSATVKSNSEIELETGVQTEGVLYTVTVSNVMDLTGNVIDPAKNSGSFTGNDRPRIESITWDVGTVTRLFINYSEAVDTILASDKTNYHIDSPYLEVKEVIQINDTVYEMRTSEQVQDETYTLYVDNVTDLTGNVIDSAITMTFTGKHCPYIVNVIWLSPLTIDVVFNEVVQINPTLVVSNWSISNNIEIYASVRHHYPVEERNMVRIFLKNSTPFITGMEYTITVVNVPDEAHNNIVQMPNYYTFTAQ